MSEPTQIACGCRDCNRTTWAMILCDICGNKRCPHATNHIHDCTGSNEPGQLGSIYGTPSTEPVKVRKINHAQEIAEARELIAMAPHHCQCMFRSDGKKCYGCRAQAWLERNKDGEG